MTRLTINTTIEIPSAPTMQVEVQTPYIVLGDTDVSDLRRQIAVLTSDLATAQGRVTSLQSDVDRLTADLSTATTDKAALQAQLTVAQASLTAAQQQVAALQAQLTAAQAEVATLTAQVTAKDTQIEQLQADLAEAAGNGRSGIVTTFAVECATTEQAAALTLSVPPLKFNKQALVSFTMDDTHGQDYSAIFAAINNRPIAYSNPYHKEQYDAEDWPTTIQPALGHTLCTTDGCGNDRRFRVESSIWTYGTYLSGTDPIRVDKGNTANDWRFNYYLKWQDLREMLDYGYGISVHDVDPAKYGTTDVDQLLLGLAESQAAIREHLGVGCKLGSEPNGNTAYDTAMLLYDDWVMGFSRSYGYQYPMSADLNLYKCFAYRLFPAEPDDYISTVTAEMSKAAAERIWLHCGCHTASITAINLLTHYYDNYGKAGDDSIWFACRDEFYEYWAMRRGLSIKKVVSGTTATFYVYVPLGKDFRFPELTFCASEAMQTLTVDDKVVGLSINADKTMFNVNFDSRLAEVAERYVAKHEAPTYTVGTTVYAKSADRKAIEQADARYFVAQLRPGDAKNALIARIDAMTAPIVVTGIAIIDKPSTITDSAQLSVAYTPADTTQRGIVWSSTNEQVATVSASGLVTVIADGSATISVRSTADATIVDSIAVACVKTPTVIALTGLSITGALDGMTAQLSVAYTPADTTQQGVIWSSSNQQVATVSAAGLVTFTAPGTVAITATSTANATITATKSLTYEEEQPQPTAVKAILSLGHTYNSYNGTNPGYGGKYDADNGVTVIRIGSGNLTGTVYDTAGNVIGSYTFNKALSTPGAANTGTITGDNSGRYPDYALKNYLYKSNISGSGYPSLTITLATGGTYKVRHFVNTQAYKDNYLTTDMQLRKGGAVVGTFAKIADIYNNFTDYAELEVTITAGEAFEVYMDHEDANTVPFANVIELERV